MSSEIDSLPTINSLLSESFLVEKYQRGYKWDIEQVAQLLEDIKQFYHEKASSFYCLQPVIVTISKIDSKRYWEVIDGQQRLTTIFLILKSISDSAYHISYRTREKSRKFLEKINDHITELVQIDDDLKKTDKMLSVAWNKFIESNAGYNTIDNYHFYKAYQYIRFWFNKNQMEKDKFRNHLLEDVRFIWHEIKDESQDAEKIFINFNKGKIPLDQADLIKAEFILQIKQNNVHKEIQELKSQNFSIEWNKIENTLQDNSFWYFVSNDTSELRKYNRIDFLFDLYFEKPKKANKFYNYFELKEIGYTEESWLKIRDRFELINEWFNDRTIYHLIGIILTFNLKKMTEIIEIYYSGKQKKTFFNRLKEIIKEKYFNQESELIYAEYDDKHLCTQILTLFNVAIEESSDYPSKFPFEKYKTTEWNLEHIHAQKSQKFKTKKEVIIWLEDINQLEQKIQNEQQQLPSEIIKSLRDSLDLQKDEDVLSTQQREWIELIDEKVKTYFSTNLLNNLCLLDAPTNKGIGNNPFNKKRIEVLEIAKQGKNKYNELVYVPMGTQRVFSKFYNFEQEEIQMSYWGTKDREIYYEAIQNTLLDFLKPLSNDQ